MSSFADTIATKNLLQDSLRKQLKRDDIKILKQELSSATKPGDHYFSSVCRGNVEYQSPGSGVEKTSFFIKFMTEIEINELAEEDTLNFDKELEIYSEIFPKMIDLTGQMFSADCLNFIKSPAKILVLEDLCPMNYKVANRKSGLDFEHCSLVLRKLAQFHASSMVLRENENQIFDNFSKGLFQIKKEEEVIKTFFSISCEVLADIVRNWSGFEGIAMKLDKIQDNFLKALYNCINRSGSKIKCLNHGDLWISNILFKYDEESSKPNDLKFVDFQVTCYNSIGIDWNYFWYTSPSMSVREESEEFMFNTYFESLTKTLKSLKFDPQKIPTSEDLRSEIRKYEFYGFAAAIGPLPLFLWDNKQDLPSTNESDNVQSISYDVRKSLMESEPYTRVMKFILKKFDEHGTLDNCLDF